MNGLVAVIAVTAAAGITFMQVAYKIEARERPSTEENEMYNHPDLLTLQRGICLIPKNLMDTYLQIHAEISMAIERHKVISSASRSDSIIASFINGTASAQAKPAVIARTNPFIKLALATFKVLDVLQFLLLSKCIRNRPVITSRTPQRMEMVGSSPSMNQEVKTTKTGYALVTVAETLSPIFLMATK